mgnify:CR=1 FL=1
MMYPKPAYKKRRKQHKKSILQAKDGTCYLCTRLNGDYSHKTLQEHHIFGGANRIHSEAYGLKVYLCVEHHTEGKAAVHNNIDNMRLLQAEGQRAFEREHTRAEFMRIFGRNYLEDGDGAQGTNR